MGDVEKLCELNSGDFFVEVVVIFKEVLGE